MRARHGPVDVVETFTIGDLHLKLDVVSNVTVLPHQELDREWELLGNQLFMKLVVYVFWYINSLWSLVAKIEKPSCWGRAWSYTTWSIIKDLMHFLCILC